MCYEFNLVIIIAYIREARAIFDLNRFEEIKTRLSQHSENTKYLLLSVGKVV